MILWQNCQVGQSWGWKSEVESETESGTETGSETESKLRWRLRLRLTQSQNHGYIQEHQSLQLQLVTSRESHHCHPMEEGEEMKMNVDTQIPDVNVIERGSTWTSREAGRTIHDPERRNCQDKNQHPEKTHKQSTRPGKTQIYRSKETCKQTCIQIGHEKSHVQTVVSIEDGINKWEEDMGSMSKYGSTMDLMHPDDDDWDDKNVE